MKIAVASQNCRTITGSGGRARRFFVFEVGPDKSVTELERLDLAKEMAMHAFRGQEHPLFEMDVVILGGCGQGFVNRLAMHGTLVLATAETDPHKAVADLLEDRLQPPAPIEAHVHRHPH